MTLRGSTLKTHFEQCINLENADILTGPESATQDITRMRVHNMLRPQIIV